MVPLARGLRTRVRLPAVSPAEPVSGSVVLDAAGSRRSPATMPGFHAGHPPHNKGLRYPADPPTVEEIVAVMRITGDGLHGRRLRGLIVVLWRAGLRIDESARAARGRPRSPPRFNPCPSRQRRTTSRDRDGRLGPGGRPAGRFGRGAVVERLSV